MTKNDGGPAFPGQRLGSDGLPECEAWNGMSLRDWFAGQALVGILSNRNGGLIIQAVEDAYDIANTMLRVRASKDG